MTTEQLIEYALGIADPPTARAVEDSLRANASTRDQLAEIRAKLVSVADAATPSRPSATLRERVLGIATPDSRYSGFTVRLARLFGIDPADARTLLGQAGVFPAEHWQPFAAAGTTVPGMHVWLVPSPLEGLCSFVYLEPGTHVPRHGHEGTEQMLIVDGWAREDSGREAGPGDLIVSAPQSAHEFEILSRERCIFAVHLDGGLRFPVEPSGDG